VSSKHTTVNRTSPRELVVTCTFDSPVAKLYGAWTRPAQLMRWWAPKSVGITFVSCDADVRKGGAYRFVFSHPDAPAPMAFHGRYLEADAPNRLVWTNEETGEAGAVTTVTFEARDGRTLLTLHDLYPTKEALDEALASGGPECFPEQFAQLESLLGET
jgi:uncharacterized protein YndB with AHSA1/START domain